MSHKTTIFSRKLFKSIQAVCALGILVIYVLGNISAGDFHHIWHAAEAPVEHSPEQEEDLCHLALFHHAAPQHCDHEFHVRDKTTCTLCDVILHNEQIIESSEVLVSPIVRAVLNEPLLHLEITAVSLTVSGRGPPAVL